MTDTGPAEQCRLSNGLNLNESYVSVKRKIFLSILGLAIVYNIYGTMGPVKD